MLKNYEAIKDNVHINCLGDSPSFNKAQELLVADDSNEMEATQGINLAKPNRAQLVKIIRATPPEVLQSIAEKFGDPLVWQREQRQDRPLTGQENN